jgi:hypothetical protein
MAKSGRSETAIELADKALVDVRKAMSNGSVLSGHVYADMLGRVDDQTTRDAMVVRACEVLVGRDADALHQFVGGSDDVALFLRALVDEASMPLLRMEVDGADFRRLTHAELSRMFRSDPDNGRLVVKITEDMCNDWEGSGGAEAALEFCTDALSKGTPRVGTAFSLHVLATAAAGELQDMQVFEEHAMQVLNVNEGPLAKAQLHPVTEPVLDRWSQMMCVHEPELAVVMASAVPQDLLSIPPLRTVEATGTPKDSKSGYLRPLEQLPPDAPGRPDSPGTSFGKSDGGPSRGPSL